MNPGAEKHAALKIISGMRRVSSQTLILILLALAVTGCSTPTQQQEPPKPAPVNPTATTVQAQPVMGMTAIAQPTQAAALPPGLVEVTPLPGSDLEPKISPVFYFNQPMDRASVEGAFQSQPSLPVRYEWIDDSTLRLVPDQTVSLDADLDLTINPGARAANGLNLTTPIQVSYRAPVKLRVVERLPKPGSAGVNPTSAVAVTFNQPIVALGADPSTTPPAFQIEPAGGTPAPAGRGEWLNTSTYIFYPLPALFGGTQYTVKINPALSTFEGRPLPQDQAGQEWSFTTSAPAILSLEPGTEQPVNLDESFSLTFNQAMDMASVESNFQLLRPDASPVSGKFRWNETATQVTFTPDTRLERDTAYSVVLSGAALSQGGAPLGQDFAATLSTVPQFGVIQTRPEAGEALEATFGYASVSITLSAPIAPGQDLSSLVTLSPAVTGQDVNRSMDGDQITVNGYFLPSTSYTLTIAPGLSDRWGATLGVPYTFTFSTTPARPTLTIPVHQSAGDTVFVPFGETSLPAQSTNIERLALSRGSLTLAEYIHAEESYQGVQNWEPLVNSSWDRLYYPTANTNETLDIPLQEAEEPLAPGLYFLKIDPQPAVENHAITSPVMFVVSPIELTLKTSLTQAFVWAVRAASQEAAAGETVTIYDQAAQPLGSCQTDAAGICQVELPPVYESEPQYYAVIGQPGDANFSLAAMYWSQGVNAWDLEIGYQRESQPYKVYLYTDRPIYRPGQAVFFKAVARMQNNGRYGSSELDEMIVDVVSPYDPLTSQSQVVATLRLPLTNFDTASGTYTLPEDARPGMYTLRPQGAQYQETYFSVAEYRKPEIDLQVLLSQEDLLFGEDVQAEVMARYFFGAPAGNVQLRWTLFSEPGYPNLSGGLQAGRIDTSWMEPWAMSGQAGTFISEGQGMTGPDGALALRIPGSVLRDRFQSLPGNLMRLTLEVTVEDESGLPVSSRDQLNLHPSSYTIGAKPEMWSVSVDEDITYSVKTVDWQGNPLGDLPLTAHFSKVTWVQEEAPGPESPPQYRMQTVEVGSTDFRSSETGDARLTFTPTEPGTFMVEITGEEGAITQVLTWVGGPGFASWPALPNQRLMLRAETTRYQPGDTAKIFLPNPFEGDALALITVERGRVMRSQVIQVQGASYELALPLGEEDAPNIYVGVTLLGKTKGRPDFRVGYVDLKVDPASQLLQVEVKSSPAQARPGEDVTLTIRARDEQGDPVQGEFSLALVDKAVLALADPNTPPIEEAFYGEQWLGVRSSYSLAAYAGRSVYVPGGRGGGGGGDGLVGQQALREEFKDTAYWNGAIQTDVTGAAQVTLKLPDNLTTWRADVRGVTEDTKVGSATLDLVTSKPLLVRPVTPRFAVQGDHIELAAVVHNNTTSPIRASVRLEGAGFTLDDLNSAVQPVDLPAGERLRVSWWGSVQDVDALDLVFSAESDALRDSTRPEGGPIPVLRYVVPQTFGTSGVIAGPGTALEMVSVPRSFSPAGGDLRVELSPSLAGAVVDGLEIQDNYARDFNEPVISRLLPNLAMYAALRDFQVANEPLSAKLKEAVTGSVAQLVIQQNEDGGWGWVAGASSSPYLSSTVLLGLSRAAQAGVFVDPAILQKGAAYLEANLLQPGVEVEAWQLDQLALRYFILREVGRTGADTGALYELRDRLSPWGKAFLALALEDGSPGDTSPKDERARTLLSDLQASASRSATGAHWEDPNPAWHSWSSPNFTTAVVAYAIARLDPQSQVLADSVRYLILNRRPQGGWSSSYEGAWAMIALVETARGTGDLQTNYHYWANLNGSPLMDGQVANAAAAVQPVISGVSLASLAQTAPNALEIGRGEGSGRLYYRAYLQVSRPAQDAPAISRGMTLSRQYFNAAQDCREEACQPVTTASLSNPEPLLVRLSLTVPEDMYYVVVEDRVPAGVEILNPGLKTSQQILPQVEGEGEKVAVEYSADDPFSRGWGWWLFQNPQVYSDHIRWVVDYLPAGTYELTYRVTPFLAGEFQVIPAHAYQNYFPEVEGYSPGGVLIVE